MRKIIIDWSHWWLDIDTLENVLWKYNFFSWTVMIPPYNSNINRNNDMNSQWKTKAFTFCSQSVQINLHRTLIIVTLRVFDVVSGCYMSRGNWEKHDYFFGLSNLKIKERSFWEVSLNCKADCWGRVFFVCSWLTVFWSCQLFGPFLPLSAAC